MGAKLWGGFVHSSWKNHTYYLYSRIMMFLCTQFANNTCQHLSCMSERFLHIYSWSSTCVVMYMTDRNHCRCNNLMLASSGSCLKVYLCTCSGPQRTCSASDVVVMPRYFFASLADSVVADLGLSRHRPGKLSPQ